MRGKRGGGNRATGILTLLSLLAVVAFVVSVGARVVNRYEPGFTELKDIRVQVLNGSGEEGAASRTAELLTEAGYSVTEVKNADRYDYKGILIVDRTGDRKKANDVARFLGVEDVILQRSVSDLEDVLVIVGKKR
ncbi:MAG: LytR C-terminal domain-containing protein [Candidatus Eisenbacteria bacterium]|nr:LytR C-terminal domain-containing protein [Candidatus Eisenbacteria bacterium]